MATFETMEIIGAAHWASALINGDESGLTDKESAMLAAWCDRELVDGWHIVDVKRECACDETDESSECFCDNEAESPWFSWSFGFHTGWDSEGIRGGDLLTYIAHRNVPDAPRAPDPEPELF